MAALARLEPHPHAGDVVLDGADDFPVPSEVSRYQAEIVCIGKCDSRSCALFSVKFVAIFLLHVLQMKKHRIEDHEKDSGTQWITLENTSSEMERVRSPSWSLNHSLTQILQQVVKKMPIVSNLWHPLKQFDKKLTNIAESWQKVANGAKSSQKLQKVSNCWHKLSKAAKICQKLATRHDDMVT